MHKVIHIQRVEAIVLRQPREFEKVVVARAGRLQEYAVVSGQMVKQ